MNKEFTNSAKEVINAAGEASERLGHSFIGTEHLLIALSEVDRSTAGKVLQIHRISPDTLEKMIKGPSENSGLLLYDGSTFSPKAEKVLEDAGTEADKYKARKVGTEHILLAILKTEDCSAMRLLLTMGVNLPKMFADIYGAMHMDPEAVQAELKKLKGNAEKKPAQSQLEKFSKDMCQAAREGKLDPVIGRTEEIARIVQILSRRTKNNP
ncbi:MAG: ATP-dependent Clp protease ATP-binding subunit, partial [Parasporobacterium sp.]|nr:ATP-dependent Clp protease ATP-binding subunit [Parasporobacterium sp.]